MRRVNPQPGVVFAALLLDPWLMSFNARTIPSPKVVVFMIRNKEARLLLFLITGSKLSQASK
jgi:hypothetical protein